MGMSCDSNSRPSVSKILWLMFGLATGFAFLVAGCGGGGGTGSSGAAAVPSAGAQETRTGAVTVRLDYSQAARESHKSATRKDAPTPIPSTAVRFVIHVLDAGGLDVVAPTAVQRAAGEQSQTVTITGVPLGSYRLVVEMFGATGDALGFAPPMNVVVAPGVPAEVVLGSVVTLTLLSITPPAITMAMGTSQGFQAVGVFSDGSTVALTGLASWSSLAPNVATVSALGIVSTLAPGATTLTAACSGQSATSAVIVTGARLVGVEVTPVAPHLASGTTVQLHAVGAFSDGTTQDLTSQVSWTVEEPSVASVTSTGLVTGTQVGTSGISASILGQSGSTTLTVTAAILVSIDVTPPGPSVALGRIRQFTATGTYTDHTTQDVTATVTWASSDPTRATISSGVTGGLALSLANGSTTITAADPTTGIAGSTTLTVTSATLVSIAVTPTNPSIPVGLARQFIATGTFTDNSTQDLTATATWTSSDDATATMSNASGSKGLASTVATGTTTVTATDPTTQVAGSSALTVTSATLVSIAVSPSNRSVPRGLTRQFTATGTYTDNSTQNLTITATWTSSDPTKAAISNASSFEGLASTLATGSTTITATDPTSQIAGSTTLTVTAATLASIGVTPTNPGVPRGLTRQFTATGTYTDSSTQNLTTTVTWTSTDVTRATVSNASGSEGLASTLATGSTTITATDPTTQVVGSTTLTVTPATLVSIAVTPTNPSVAKGLTRQFTATGTYTDTLTQDLTTTVTWSSSDLGSAAISNAEGTRGLATTLAVGMSTITATDPTSQIAATTMLTVAEPGLVSIAVTPADASLNVGQLQRYVATGRYTDNSTQDLTAAVSWSSSDTAQATVSNVAETQGRVAAVAVGTSTITADAGSGAVGSTTVTITVPSVGTDGLVSAIAVGPDGTRYIGGTFTRVASIVGHLLPLNTTTGAVLDSFPPIDGYVYAVVRDGQGGWYVGGQFSQVGPVARNNIAHILSDGSVDLAWNPNANAFVYVLALNADGTRVYAGGEFTAIGGQTRNRIAVLAATDGTADPAWNPNASDPVTALAVSKDGTRVYVGGVFTSIGGQTRNRIAALSVVDGTADPSWNPNANGTVFTFAVSADGSKVYTGGSFTSIGGQSRGRIAVLSAADGSADASWNPSADSSVYRVALNGDGSKVYAGGGFYNIGGQARKSIAVLSVVDGTADVTWNPNVNGAVRALAVSQDGSRIYIGGDFISVGDIGALPRNYLAAVSTVDGTVDAAWNPNADNSVYALAVSDDGSKVYAGGHLSFIGGQTRNNIAALGPNGDLQAWNPNANSQVRVLLASADGSKVYAGGNFTAIGGQTRRYIAALSTVDGTADAGWNPDPNAVVFALASSPDGSRIYAGGSFTGIGGQPFNRLAALKASDGTADAAWNPHPDGTVNVMTVSGDGSTVYAGGSFVTIGGVAYNNIVAISAANGTANPAWNPTANGRVAALALSPDGTRIYAGGDFTSIGGQARNRIASLSVANGTADVTWNPNANDGVSALALSGDGSRVFVGGYFGSIGGQGRAYIASLSATDGTADAAWNPNSNGWLGALALSRDGSRLYAGGTFTLIGGQMQSRSAALDALTGTPVIGARALPLLAAVSGDPVLTALVALRPSGDRSPFGLEEAHLRLF